MCARSRLSVSQWTTIESNVAAARPVNLRLSQSLGSRYFHVARAMSGRSDCSQRMCAIESLPDRYRLALVLRDLEGLAYEEVSLVLGIPGGTVRSRINRARLMVKDKLESLVRTDYL